MIGLPIWHTFLSATTERIRHICSRCLSRRAMYVAAKRICCRHHSFLRICHWQRTPSGEQSHRPQVPESRNTRDSPALSTQKGRKPCASRESPSKIFPRKTPRARWGNATPLFTAKPPS